MSLSTSLAVVVDEGAVLHAVGSLRRFLAYLISTRAPRAPREEGTCF